MRLAKYLAHAGVASRRAAEAIIADGRVRIGGDVVTDPARDVDGTVPVSVDGNAVAIGDDKTVWIVHKPRGVVSTAKDTHDRPTVVDMVDAPGTRLYPVGRLDADTTGLILLTDDGDLANRLTHPRYEVPKVYVASVGRGGIAVPDQALRRLREGVQLDDGRTAPAGVRQLKPGVLEITLREGRKRQIKRMCTEVGHPVHRLQRVAFGPLRLGDLREGKVRRLTPAEVQRLRDAAAPPDRASG
ncbi:Ribosomal large subunit pseudouridine synthase B [Baekduia alba]|uniref:pseudouridine synthase n=1 Tax=Baekduia alba TaxID=2997333 RepID=UPI00234214FE|nr:pseudouridine synthase [Baekduia alba]WCB93670.1 Ribosomal large subunit pseudouridine synthase B [Baekduia alba]